MKFKSIIIFLFAAAVLSGCGKKEEKPSHEGGKEAAIKVSVASVEKGDLSVYTESVGTVRAAREATVASKIMGSVSRLNFKEGDKVKEGTVLVEIDDRDIVAQLEQAQAAVSEASASYRNAEINLNRMRSLLEQRSATQQQVDNAVMQFDMAKAKTQQAHANVEALKVMQGYTRVSAPFGGVIVERDIEKGEMTAPGKPLFKISDDRILRLETEIKESDIKGMKVGRISDVRVDAVDKTIKGTISQIIPSGDAATHSFLVKIDLPRTEGVLPGMFGRAYLTKGVNVSLLVPKSAIIEREGNTGVFVIKDKNAAFRMIKTGMTSGDKVEVLSGVTEGEMAAISNIEALSDGSRVEIVK